MAKRSRISSPSHAATDSATRTVRLATAESLMRSAELPPGVKAITSGATATGLITATSAAKYLMNSLGSNTGSILPISVAWKGARDAYDYR